MQRFLLILVAITAVMLAGCSRTVDASKFNAAEWEKQIKDPGLSEKEFTRLYALKVAAEFKGAQVQIAGERELKIKLPNGSELTAYLDNAWNEAAKDAENRVDIVKRYMVGVTAAQSSTSEDSEPPDTNNIVAVIRDSQFAAQIKSDKPGNKIVSEPLVADLSVFYAIDEEGRIHYLTENDRAKLNLGLPALRKLAMTNLKRLLPEVSRKGSAPVFGFVADGNYESSLLLSDKLWEEEAKNVEGDIVAAVPSRDVLVFTGSKSKDGIATVREVVSQVEKGGDHLISSTLIVRRNGRWEKFAD
jgi:uncharacterized protein YtpQ (UPF0354 family)